LPIIAAFLERAPAKKRAIGGIDHLFAARHKTNVKVFPQDALLSLDALRK